MNSYLKFHFKKSFQFHKNDNPIDEELHVNNDPWSVEDEEGDNDVEENQEQVQLLLQLIL